MLNSYVFGVAMPYRHQKYLKFNYEIDKLLVLVSEMIENDLKNIFVQNLTDYNHFMCDGLEAGFPAPIILEALILEPPIWDFMTDPEAV